MKTVSGICICNKCENSGRSGIYRMIGRCTNCGDDPVLMLFRQGDQKHNLECPNCGSPGGYSQGIMSYRLANDDEIPESEGEAK
jgi:DNA-directed RNA polymerase subunit RPC12/RpoP